MRFPSSAVSREFGKKLVLNPNALFHSVIPAKAGIQGASNWTPAFAGVTLFLNLFAGHYTRNGFKRDDWFSGLPLVRARDNPGAGGGAESPRPPGLK